MAEIGNGYGSECHLLRYMGRHRKLLDEQVLAATGGQEIEWLDFSFDPTRVWGDGELKALSFVTSPKVQSAWKAFWPQRGNAPNWDAVGRINRQGTSEWLLVEAKGNLGEVESSCSAKDDGGRRQIADALEKTKRELGVAAERDWMSGYYQFANRVALLQFLISTGEAARLLFVYFTGDRNGVRSCPATADGWSGVLARQEVHLGLESSHPLAERIHKVFLEAHVGDKAGGKWGVN